MLIGIAYRIYVFSSRCLMSVVFFCFQSLAPQCFDQQGISG